MFKCECCQLDAVNVEAHSQWRDFCECKPMNCRIFIIYVESDGEGSFKFLE